MPYLIELADILRKAGLPVREVPGWQTRGHGAMGAVLGVLAHHTAGGASGDFPSEKVVVNGRTGLAGPLCNLGVTRAGTWVVVAAGQAWHAGTGSISWCPANSGNSRLIGVEAESVGTRDDWTPAQRANYPRGVAALLRHYGLPASRVIGHKEWAPNRKIDPAFWDMNAFRSDTARWMTATQGTDMPLSNDDLIKIRDIVWQAPIPDLYTAKPEDDLPAFAALGWANAHAAFARGASESAAVSTGRVEARLAAGTPTTTPTAGPVSLTDADVARVAAAVVDLLSKRTAS
jgi:hypothetical protein